jgi:hypothetical protein
MTILTDLIAAAHEMRDAHGARATAYVLDGELAKADEAALKRFEVLAASLATAEALAALVPTIDLRSAAEDVIIKTASLVHLLPTELPPPDMPDSEALAWFFERHSDTVARGVWTFWCAWRAGAAFDAKWRAFLAVVLPAQGERARTMDNA